MSDSTAFRGVTPARADSDRSDPAKDRGQAFQEESPGWSVSAPRSVRSTQDQPPLVPGGLFVGAHGKDANGILYRLVAPLDRGGMGELFIAEVDGPSGLPRHAVIKRLLPDLLDDDDYIKMFSAEAELMAQLNHPSVVRVLGMPIMEGTTCLALEFVDGRSVQQLVSRTRRLRIAVPPAIAAFIIARVAEALDHVHHARAKNGRPLELVHRDVSPGNVLVGFDGAVKLTDFGIAKSRMSAVSTTVGIVKGKARYLAPEQILGQRATPRSDVFSAAVVLVEMLTSKPLFERGSIPKTLYGIVHGERPRMSDLLPLPAQPLADLLELALATSAENRLATAKALAEGLNQLAATVGPPIDAETLGQHLRGVFAGTEGPLTRVQKVKAPLLPQTGAAPLDPSAFRSSRSARADRSPTPLPIVDPVEAEKIRSAPHEVDEALSVLAWLQGRSSPSASQEARAAKAASARRKRRQVKRVPWFLFGALCGAAAFLSPLVAVTDLREAVIPKVAAYLPPDAETKLQALFKTPAAENPSEPAPVDKRPMWERLSFSLEPLRSDLFVGPAAPPPPPPQPAPAQLEVVSPKKWRLYIDGERAPGRVPLKIDALSPGLHKVELRKGNSRPRRWTINFRPGEIVTVGKDLRRELPDGSTEP